MLLTRQAVLAATAVETRDVKISQGVVRVRGLSGAERDSLEASTIMRKGKNQEINLSNFRAKLCVRAMIGEDGKRLFEDRDAELLSQINAKDLAKIYDAASELSGISEADVDELTKNFESDQSGNSGLS